MENESINCPHCGYLNYSTVKYCINCGTKMSMENKIPEGLPLSNTLTESGLAVGLSIVGWIYFLIGTIGGVIILKEFDDTFIRIFAISAMFTNLMVLLICLGISQIIKQNIYIIKNQSSS